MTTCQTFAGIETTFGDGAKTYVLSYRVRNQPSTASAEIEVSANTPSTYNGAVRRSWRMKSTSPKTWDVEVFYTTEVPRTPSVGETTISGRFTRDTFTMTHGLDNVRNVAATGRTAMKTFGAINVDRHGINGIDMPVKAMSLTVAKTFAPGTLTNGYLDTLEKLVQTVNDADWKRWSKGEVLLEDAQYEITSESETLTLDVAISRNITTQLVIPASATPGDPGVITIPPVSGIVKYGWDYMWFEVEEGEAGGVPAQNLVAAHIDRVHDFGNFSLLGF